MIYEFKLIPLFNLKCEVSKSMQFNKKYYINVSKIMQDKNINLPRPRLKITTVTVPLWSDLNVRN